MKLETEHSGIRDDVTEEDLLRVFDDDEARGGFVILTSDDGSFLQAAGEGSSAYTLEFFPEKDVPRYQQATTQLNKDQVRAAFTDFLCHGNTWYENLEWREIKNTGCLGVLAVSAAVIVGSAVAYYLSSAGV
jgi:hypothetical protein